MVRMNTVRYLVNVPVLGMCLCILSEPSYPERHMCAVGIIWCCGSAAVVWLHVGLTGGIDATVRYLGGIDAAARY